MSRSWFYLVVAAGLCCGLLHEAAARAQDKKGTLVEFDSLKSRTPASWVEEPPTNAMRLAQFKLPKVEGDSRDAEVVIFKGISGSAEDNIKRWKGMFEPPTGKKIDDVAKVTEMKVGEAELAYLDIYGTYLFKAQPFNPNAKADRLPNYRMVAVAFQTKQTPYHIRMVGPEKTVEHYRKGFDEWLKAFK
jgi:hypothetical protein